MSYYPNNPYNHHNAGAPYYDGQHHGSHHDHLAVDPYGVGYNAGYGPGYGGHGASHHGHGSGLLGHVPAGINSLGQAVGLGHHGSHHVHGGGSHHLGYKKGKSSGYKKHHHRDGGHSSDSD